MKKIMKKTFIFFMICSIFLVGCQRQKEVTVSEKEIPVEILEVKASTYDKKITVPGVVISDKEIVYSFRMEGEIDEILVEEGEIVEKNDLLATLNEEDYRKHLEISRLQVKSAKAAYDNAKKALIKSKANYDKIKEDIEKIKVLYRDGSISKSEYEDTELRFNIAKENYDVSKGGAIDLAKANYDRAVTDYSMKEEQFSNGEIRSNFRGYIKTVYVKEGNQVKKNESVIALGSVDAQVVIGLSSEEKENIKIGDKVEIKYGAKIIEGQIKSISDVLDSNSLLYKVNIYIPQNSIPSYSIIKVDIKVGKKNGVKIPIKAVLNDGLPFVFIVEDDHAVKRKVSIIGYDKEYVFVEGISNKEKIITVGNKVLRGGERVNIN